jgi:hypothetical protein
MAQRVDVKQETQKSQPKKGRGMDDSLTSYFLFEVIAGMLIKMDLL